MDLRSFRTALVLLPLLLASSPLRADVVLDSLLPAEGTVGTALDLRLTGDTGKGKPKVWFTLADDTSPKPKKTKVKVSGLTDLGGGLSSLAMSFTKTKTGPGVYDLHVKPKGKGQLEQVFEAAFTMLAPNVDSVSPNMAAAKAEVTIVGDSFGGPKKPKVLLVPAAGGKPKKAKVKQVTSGTALAVKLPKLSAGSYNVVVSNKVGQATLVGGLTITGTGGPGDPPPGDYLTATLASTKQALFVTQFMAGQPGTVLQAFNVSNETADIAIITAGQTTGAGDFSMSITFPFNAGVTPTPFTVEMGGPEGTFAVTASQGPQGQAELDATWGMGFANESPGTLTVTSATSNRMTGSFEFTIVPAGGVPAASDLLVTQGEFDVSLP